MNRERIKGLITQLGKIPARKFGMSEWIRGMVTGVKPEDAVANEKNTCGTSACIAGWAVLMYSDNPQAGSGASEKAQDLLGLTSIQADRLFYGRNPDGHAVKDLKHIKREEAIDVLNILLETGEVRWDKVVR